MSVKNFLDNLASAVEKDVQSTEAYCKAREDSGAMCEEKPIDIACIKSNNTEKENLERLNLRLDNAKKELGELESQRADLEKHLAQLEKAKQELKTDHLQEMKTLEHLKVRFDCYKQLFPVEFDYSDENLTGFMKNEETGEYHGFMLPRENTESNVKHAWKHLEKLYLE